MEKLRETVIKLASANQKEPLSSSQLALIDQRLHESFPLGLRLPSHPTYASMVFKAINELCEQGGSSEGSISEHIKANFDDLPWAHKSILKHHLNRLCVEGLIVLDSDRYSIPGSTQKPVLKKGKLKRKLVRNEMKNIPFQESNEFEALESRHGVEDDEPVKNGCEDMLVVEDEEEKKGEEAQECEKSFITIPSIAETVKTPRILRQGKCDQLLTRGPGKDTLVDDCQDNTRTEILALEDDSNGNETPVMKKKKNAEKGHSKREKSLVDECRDLEDDSNGNETPVMKKKNAEKGHSKREKSLVDECCDLEDDSNGGASFETVVKKKKKKNDPRTRTDRLIVCGIAAKSPKPTSGSERRVTRQSSKSKEQPKKLITSGGKEIVNPPEPKKLIISPVNPLPSSNLQNGENPQEDFKQTESEQRRVTRQLSKSKEQPKKLMTSPVNPDPSSKLQKHDNPQEPSPDNEFPSSELQNHENPQEASNPKSQEAKSTWPSWVQSLLDTDFYGKCKVHANVEKSSRNFYCLDCTNGALCTSCLTSHEGHNVIGIKQTDFEAGVETSAIEKHIDVSGIHTYKGYGTKTTIVLKRTIPRTFPVAANHFCRFCQLRLLYDFDFCTLSCKYQHEQRLVGSMPCKIK